MNNLMNKMQGKGNRQDQSGYTNEQMQYIALNGQAAFAEREARKLSAKELERLRDEFAIEMAGKLLMKTNISGMIFDSNGLYKQIMTQAYLLADEGIKAREQSK